MNKIIFTAATALLVSAGAAFAGGSGQFPAYEPVATASIDYGTTASISDGQNSTVKVQDSDRGVFGR
ncbi:DUF680 domain-containing protein [Mesorhizobium sp. A556]